ncbi:hypothetical protein CGK42_24035 [Vibrio parahaemolyticus]|nr:hypothetical protein CGK42_24035 [Vibrio parahaemolyticus]
MKLLGLLSCQTPRLRYRKASQEHVDTDYFLPHEYKTIDASTSTRIMMFGMKEHLDLKKKFILTMQMESGRKLDIPVTVISGE